MRLHEKLRDDVIAQLKDGYDLTHVDQGDKLMSEQIDGVVAGDWEKVWGSSEDWEYLNRDGGARYEIKDEVAWVVKEWEEHDRLMTYIDAGEITDLDDFDDYGTLADKFEETAEWYEVLEAIKERDTSDPYKELAHRSGSVLMRQVIAGEDASLYGNHNPRAVLDWLIENAEEGTVLKRNKHNYEVVRSVIAESMHSLAYSMGMLVYAADVGDLYDMGDVEWVEIVNPFLYIGNYYQGDGYCSDKPLDAVFRVKRSDLTTDTGAAGYGWNEAAGVYTSAYEAELRPVPNDTKEDAA